MARVVYAPGALADLERLSDFLLAEMPDEAARTAELLLGAIDMLAEHPLLGRGVEQGFRELVISRGRSGYLALYSLEAAGEIVLVAAIRHQREVGYFDDSQG